jgi:hypothetical protein
MWRFSFLQLIKSHTTYSYSVNHIIIVPHSKSGIFPRSSLLGVGSWGSGNLERVEQLGEGWGKQGQFTSNLRRRWTIPVTAGGCQVSGRGIKGSKGNQQGEQKGLAREARGKCAIYM